MVVGGQAVTGADPHGACRVVITESVNRIAWQSRITDSQMGEVGAVAHEEPVDAAADPDLPLGVLGQGGDCAWMVRCRQQAVLPGRTIEMRESAFECTNPKMALGIPQKRFWMGIEESAVFFIVNRPLVAMHMHGARTPGADPQVARGVKGKAGYVIVGE